jgi:uracil-DNA glycosylase
MSKPPKINPFLIRNNPKQWEEYAYDILNEIESLDRDFELETVISKPKLMSEPKNIYQALLEQLPEMDPDWRVFFDANLPLIKDIVNQIPLDEKVYPPPEQVFRFATTPLKSQRVLIFGQDPYHGQGQACGLAFSVNEGVRLPPSLVNIFKELYSDLGIASTSGDLSTWASRGVLLLNTSLTVVEGQANSHAALWQPFTQKLVKFLSEELLELVVVCWGNSAIRAARIFKTQPKLTSPHPSPFSAHTGFFGSKPFSQVNAILKQQGHFPINWRT